MKNNEAMKAYRIPTNTTKEELERNWSHVLNFGDKVLLAGYLYNGRNNPCYFGATYKYTDSEKHDSESPLELCEASELEFMDEGHAIAWAMTK